MDPFPFSESEWSALNEIAIVGTNASLANDHILRDSCFVELQHFLAELRSIYGDHPVLLETEADFTHDIAVRVALYERARDLALVHGLPTLSIRTALAQTLLDDLHQWRRAFDELMACECELTITLEVWERDSWQELMKRCRRLEDG